MEKQLSPQELEKHILEFLATQGMCVLATCSGTMPRASAVEFFPKGTTLYVLTEGGRKIENLRQNPLVSVAIHTQFTGWDRIKGIQLTGTAEIGRSGSLVFIEGERAYRERKGDATLTVPPSLWVIKIRPQIIEYLDTTLRKQGYPVRHRLEYP
jgi:uncharacterized protein YhbP (UPF0306 family)